MIDKDKKVVAASYIFSFYQDIEFLNNDYAHYLNLMLEFENRYPNKEKIEGANQDDKQTINKYCQQVRYQVHKVFIKYQSIIPALKIGSDKDLENSYKQLTSMEGYIINREVLNTFVKAVNKCLVNGVIQELLSTNQDLINSIYDTEKPSE